MKTTSLRNWLSCVAAALISVIIATAPALAAGTPFLIKDITTTAASVNAGQLFDAGSGVLYFSANDGANGNELFMYDGTTVTQVKDINPGPSSSNPADFVKMGGVVYFTADNGTVGRELWKTDGTSGGTSLVADINATGNSSSTPSQLTVLGTNLYFVADDGVNGNELFKYDGTTTSLVLDINTTAATGSTIQYLKAVGTKLFFWANDGINGVRLWCYDGTSAISVTPATFQPASPIYDLNGKALFAATDWYAVTGVEPWISDGTPGGTTRFDVTSGTASGFHGNEFGVLGSFGYFMGGTLNAGSQNLYRTDGTSAGYFNAVRIPKEFVNAGTNMFFVGNDGQYGLWKTDGSTVSLVAKPNTDAYWNSSYPPAKLTAVGTKLFFVSPDSTISPTSYYLWVTDGTTTTRIAALTAIPQNLTDVNGTLFYVLAGELWKSDGTTGGTVKVAIATSGTAGTAVTGALNIKGVTYFVADDGVNGSELWKSDGTTAGTVLVKDIYPGSNGSQPGNLADYNGNLVFTAYDPSNGSTLWISDGTGVGTIPLLTALAQVPQSFAVVKGLLYFNASNNSALGDELWSSDGTAAGTSMVKDINTGNAASSSPRNLTDVNGTLFFSADDGTNGVELWKSDGTEAGTVMVKDINTSSAGAASSPAWLTNVGGTLFFSADDGINGSELWKSDGTAAGTVIVADINTTTTGAGSTPKWLKNGNGLLYFGADNGVNGYQLFTSDGTTTISPATINTTGNAIDPNYDPMFTVFNGMVYFVATNGSSGKELWKSDGTAGGTSLVKDINGVATESYIKNLMVSNGALYFAADDSISGAELWSSDGTTAGTVLAADVLSGSSGSNPTYLVGSGAYLHFFADDGTHGNEPMGVLLDSTPPTDGLLTVTPGDGKNVLSWTAASDANGIASYKLAWGSAMPGDCSTGTDIGNVTSLSHDTLTNGQPYYYRVCAVDSGGNVSAGATGSATPSYSAVSVVQGSVAFGNQVIGSVSSPSPVTISNISTGPVTISAVTLLGADAGDFAATGGTCGTALPYVIPASSNCDISVTFLPQAGAVASRAATLSVTTAESGTPSAFSALSGAAQASVTATAGAGGVISPAGSTAQAAGTSLSYTITPDAGYHIVDVVLDGATSIGAKTGYTFSALAGNHTINATFATVPASTSLPFVELFDSGTLPAGWSNIDNGSGNWVFNTTGNATGGAGGYAQITTSTWDSELRTPSIDMSSATTPTLEFKSNYTGTPDTLSVDISTDNGGSWINVWKRIGGGPFLASTVIVDITSAVAANKSSVITRFRFVNGDGTSGAWSVDDVRIYDLPVVTLSLAPGDSVLYDFTSGSLPTGWSVRNNIGNAGWRFDDPSPRGNLTGGSGSFAIADSDNVCSAMDTELRTLSFDMSALANAWLEFKTDFHYYGTNGEIADVDVSIDGGVTWTNMWRRSSADYRGPKTEYIDLTAIAAGKSDVRIRFHYYNANCDWYWQVDDVRLYSTCPGTVISTKQVNAPFGTSTNASIDVTSSCGWSAVSNVPWITIDSGASGSGNGTVSLTVAPGPELTGSIRVAEQTVLVKRTGTGALDATFLPPEGYVTAIATGQEMATILQPANDTTIFYKVGVEGANYTVQRRKTSDGTPLGGAGDGSITGGFDAQGRVILPTSAVNNSYPTKAVLQSDGKIVVFGYPDIAVASFELFRLDASGVLDTTFGPVGAGGYYVDSSYSVSGVSGGSLAVVQQGLYQDFNKIIVAVTAGSEVGIKRYQADGSTVDWTYTTAIGSVTLKGLTQDTSGRILLAGLKAGTTTDDGWLMSLNAAGTVDTTFGGGSSGYQTFSNGTMDVFKAVAVQPDGNIVVTGESRDTNGTGFLSVLRYTATGLLDSANFATTAATPGVLLHGGADVGGANGFYDYGASIAVQPNGKIVVGGAEWSTASGSGVATYLRLNSDGTFDGNFAYNGVATSGYLSGWRSGGATAIVLQPDGKLLSAGVTGSSNYTLRQTVEPPSVVITPDASWPLAETMVPNSQFSVVEIKNNGESLLDVSNITLTGSAEFSLDLSWDYSNTCGISNPKLTSGQFCYVLVRFNPTVPGTPSTTLTVTSNDPATPAATLVFTGNATPDTVAPVDGTIPAIAATGGNGHIALAWPAASDPGDNSGSRIASYKVVFDTAATPAANCSNGTQIYNGPNLAFTHFDLTANSTYYYRVCAVDIAGNVSNGLTASAMATGASVTWTGLAGDGLWSNAGNWTPSTVPTSGDDVLIDGSSTVTLTSGTTINSLVLGGTGTPTLAAGSNTLSISTSARIKAGAVFSNNTTASVNGNFMSDGSITGTGELYLSNCPSATFTSPFTMGKLTLYGSSAAIPSGSMLGALELFSASNPSAVTLNDNLDTATTTLTTVNSNNIINGPGALINSSGKTLDLKGVTINTAVDNSGIINFYSSGTTINGALTTHPGSALNITDMYQAYLSVANGFTNNGDITIRSDMSGYPSSLTVSNGALTNAAGATITSLAGFGDSNIYARLINQGTFTANQNTAISKASAAHGNSGTMSVASGATLTITDGTFTNDVAGKLLGSGTLDLSAKLTFSNSGTVSGADLGTVGALAITGPLPDTATAFTNIDILGTAGAGTDYDQIAVSGAATIAGNLNVNLLSSFVPSIGDSFTIMTCGASCSGTFAPSTLPSPGSGKAWTIAYNTTDVVLGVAAATGAVSPSTLPDGTYGVAYSQTVTASGGTAPYNYSIGSGTLPTGLTLNVSTGVIAGIPAAAGSNSFTIRATDALGNAVDRSYTVVIGKADPVVTWSNPAAITYGTALSGTQLNATASVPGSFVYTPASGTLLNVGADQALSATFTPSETANYNTPSSATVTINVTPAGQTVTFGTAPSLTYGGATGTVSASGGASGNPVIFTSTTPAICTVSGTTVTPVTAGSCIIAADQAGAANYIAATQVTQTITVAKATPVITWTNPASITYGTALSATQLNATAGGVAGAFDYTPVSGTVLNAGAGQVLSATFTPSDTANYNTPSPATVTINVIAAGQSISFGAAPSLTYGGGTATVSATGGASGNPVTFTSTTPVICTVSGTTVTPVTVGSCVIAADQAGAANYIAATQVTQTITVAKATPVITWTNPASITYGTALSATQLNATAGGVAGAFDYTPVSGTVLNAGAGQVLSATFTPSDTANYNTPLPATVTINVIAAGQSISFGAAPSLTYGGGTATVSAAGGASGNPVTFTSTTPAICTVSGTTVTPVTAGSCVIAADQAGNSNYNAASQVTQSITVNKAVATISLGNVVQAYDGSLKTVSVTTVPAGLSHLVTYDGSIAAPTTVGSYAVAVSINDSNYSGSTSGTLIVNKATPVITWAVPAAVPVGTTLSTTQLNASSATPGTFSYAPSAGTVMNSVGTQILSVVFTPADSANYTTQTATVNLLVTDKIIPVISWTTPAALTFGAVLDATQLNATSGGIPGTFSYTPSSGTLLAAGTHTLTATFSPSDAVTYSSTSATVSLVINKAPATVLLWAINQPQTYDGMAKTVTLTTEPTGLPVDVTYNGSATAPVVAGSYAVVATVTDANYAGTASGTMTIAKATPVITWSNPADIVNGTPLSATQLNATASVPGSFAYSPDSGVILTAGSQTLSVTFTPADSVNYAVQTKTVSLTVTALPANQVTTGADGKTIAQITVPASGANLTLGAGTLLTDASGNPISGTLTVTASVMNSIGALPTNTATAQTSDGKILSVLGNSIDITISAGASTVKTINPPMIVNLPLASTFALPGATVSYYSFDGTKWQLEGTTVVKSDNSVDMSVGHLSVWAAAVFAAAIDSTPPVISSFAIPATSSTLLVPVSSLIATDDVAVTGYLLSESAVAPLASDSAWTAGVPTDFLFPTWGNHTLYAYAKDAAGNISVAMAAPVFIGSDPVVDGVVVPALPTEPPKLEPQLPDALKSLNFAMKVEIPTAPEILHGDVAPLVNGVPQPDGKINLGDTIVILRRVVGL